MALLFVEFVEVNKVIFRLFYQDFITAAEVLSHVKQVQKDILN